MKKLTCRTLLSAALLLILALAGGCKKDEPTPTDPFNTGTGTRNQIVVISDIHCGADLTYAEFNANAGPLTELLGKIRSSENVKELVIGGDLIDEWFVPATVNTFNGGTQSDFVDRVATANLGVFNMIRGIITDGIIRVTYVPGNHDLTVTAADIERILPGIRQARDTGLLGLGTYSPDGYPQIAIEHGHRYNLFCAPDPFSNQDIAPGTILPPGYFFTRIAALHVIQQDTVQGDTVAPVTPNTSGGIGQELLYGYYQFWKGTLKQFPIRNSYDEKMIVTNIDHLSGNFAVNDLLPYQPVPGGTISVDLYRDMDVNWHQRCVRNLVPMDIPTAFAYSNPSSNVAIDTMATMQYFMNPLSNVRLVVFGHTHIARMNSQPNHAGLKSVYVNSGTWIDSNPGSTTMNFVIITPQNSDPASNTRVTLYNYQGKTFNEMAEESLRW